jgi:hypothetical protein
MGMRRLIVLTAVVVVGGVALLTSLTSGSGCGSSETQMLRDRAAGFSVSIPACWQIKPVADLSKTIGALAGTKLGSDVSDFASVKRYFKLVVINPDASAHQDAGVGALPGPFSQVDSDPTLRAAVRQDIIAGAASSGFVVHNGPLAKMNGVYYSTEQETYSTTLKGVRVKPQVHWPRMRSTSYMCTGRVRRRRTPSPAASGSPRAADADRAGLTGA